MMDRKNLVLFDMDGVLLTPMGYHRALQDTVAFLSGHLGFMDTRLSLEQIHAVEALGISNEWASSAICLAFMSELLLDASPGLDLRERLLSDASNPGSHPAPDFDSLFSRMESETDRAQPALDRGKQVLSDRVGWIVDAAYDMNGPSMPVQQEHVLGSDELRKVYGRVPLLNVPSYLLTYDRSNLDPTMRARLIEWADQPANGVVIFTNRPSMSPDRRLGTPEAELGAQTVSLEALPLAASGGVVWLEERYSMPMSTFNKPHPVHALAALRIALGDDPGEAFTAAGAFCVENKADSGWKRLDGATAWVFEDSTGGLHGLRVAKDALRELGIRIDVNLVGVAENEKKKRALQQAGALVYPDLNSALKRLYESPTL